MPSSYKGSCLLWFSWVFFLFNFAFAEDPYVYYDWTISYITASPLGVKQQVLNPKPFFVPFFLSWFRTCYLICPLVV